MVGNERQDGLWFVHQLGDVNPKLRFLLKKCSAGFVSMAFWLQVPEFSDRVLTLVENGEQVDDEVVLQIMEKVLDEKKIEYAGKSRSETDFEFGNAKSAIRRLRKAIQKKESASGGDS